MFKTIKQFSGEYRFLSNFHPSPIWYNGFLWPTVEHAYQAAKTDDEDEKAHVLACLTPGRAKRMGKDVKLRDDWQDVCVDTMRTLTMLKFAAHPDLRRMLVNTGYDELQEGNTWGDVFWGVNIKTGVGQNYLGNILMNVRHWLR